MATFESIKYDPRTDVIQRHDPSQAYEMDPIDWRAAIDDPVEVRPVVGWAPYTHLVIVTVVYGNAGEPEQAWQVYELCTCDPTA